ncbi:hypothetical protein [Marinicella sp. W31]|uniref:hypothetical protein n=1 Tax=Marinicella sp. W31 TaxID=3023713 RepID=UPI0037579018
MGNSKNKTLLITAVLALCLISSHSQADAYSVDYQNNALEFKRNSIVLNHAAVSLNISGPADFSFKQQYAANAVIRFDLNDRNVQSMQDGTYRYQLTLIPTTQNRSVTFPDSQNNSVRQNGIFSVKQGQLVSADVAEQGGVNRDQTFFDDIIAQSSLCVGQDCVNGESFDFDTIRLKENNLRIRFVDTSNSASFPSTDWELRANSTQNGGGNFFSIVDFTAGREIFSVEGGAPTSSLYVDSSGRVGLGTNNPRLNQHILSGNTPSIRLEQDGSGGFPSQTWDLGGNETDFFIRDNGAAEVPFKIQPAAPTDSFVIRTDGDIEIGGSIINNRSPDLPTISLNGNGRDRVPSLTELKQHITAYQQLPEISGSKARDMQLFQLQLLEKIQQLTLYTIQQEERIQELEDKLYGSR